MIHTLRRRVLLIPLLIVIAASISGGVVAAQALGGGSGGSHQDRLIERAAEILGIDPVQLKEAFGQAGAELADQKISELLDKLVANGHLDEAEAAKIQDWLDARPESIGTITASTLLELLGGDGPNFRSVLRMGRPAISAAVLHGDLTQEQADAIDAWLDDFPASLLDEGLPDAIELFKIQIERRAAGEDLLPPGIGGLVEAGIITQAQADDLKAWWDARPAAVDGLLPGPLQFSLPFAESFFFDGNTDGLKNLKGLLGGLGEHFDLQKLFPHHGDAQPADPAPGTFRFDAPGIPFGDRLRGLFAPDAPLILPDLRNFDGRGLGALRERLRQQFQNRFGDGEPFHFQFQAPEAAPGDGDSAPSIDSNTLTRSA